MWTEKEPGLRFVPLEARLKNGTGHHGFHQSFEHAVNANMERHDANRLNPFPLPLQPLK